MMNLYLASNEYRVYVALYEQDGQTIVRRWSHVGKCTPDSLALENALDAITQMTYIVPLVIFSQNATLIKGATDYLPERRYRMANQLPVNHAHLWLLLDRHIDEWLSYRVPLEWRQGSHPKALAQLQRR